MASLVLPPRPLVPNIVPLSPLDQHQARAYFVRFILCFPLSNETTPTEVFSNLQRSLSRTISSLPFIAGHFVPGANGEANLKIEAEDGVELRYKDLTKPGNELPGFQSYEELKKANFPVEKLPESVVSPVGLLPDDFDCAPAVIAQSNFLPGGVLLCVAFHHTLCDARGSATIVKRWAEEHSRLSGTGTGNGDLPIETDRIAPYLLVTANFDPILGEDFTTVPKPPETESPRTGVLTVHFSASVLSRLKVLATSKIHGSSWISTHDALAAYIWHCVTRARGPQVVEPKLKAVDDLDDVELTFACALDARERIQPPLPQYIGNMSIFRLARLQQTHLLQQPFISDKMSKAHDIPIARTAQVIRQRLSLVDSKHIENVFSLVSSTPVTTKITSTVTQGRVLMSSSWAETGVGLADWGTGLGTPERIRIPNMLVGGMFIMPKAGVKEGLDVILVLEETVLGRMKLEIEEWGIWQ